MSDWTGPDERMADAMHEAAADGALLVDRENTLPVPDSWCVIVCEQGCRESWTVDVDEFEPPLTADQIEEMLTPELLAHERDRHRGDLMAADRA